MINKLLASATLAASVFLAPALAAEVVVIVHPSVTVNADADDVADLFLGKSGTIDGTALTPINQDAGNPVRTAFYKKATGKNAAQLNAYWSRIIFTGKGQPPQESGDSMLVKEAVARDPSLIGYIDSTALDETVKTIVSLP